MKKKQRKTLTSKWEVRSIYNMKEIFGEMKNYKRVVSFTHHVRNFPWMSGV